MASTPASRATPVPEREAQLLAIGKQCSEAACHMIDFLPFKCQHCKQSFCQEHFRVEAHRCPEYDETKHDRVAPNCPLCNTPVAIPPGQNPNVRMDAHLTRECSVMTGAEKKKSSPVCAKANCKKVLFSPIKCTQCQEQFCPSHRFPADHSCATSAATTPGTRFSKTAGSRLLNEFNGNKLNNTASAASSAMKKTVASASASVSKSIANARVSAPAISKTSSSNSSTKSPGNNPFSKVDRRARAERESRLKAMRERARKGLLSEEEKVILAEEEAALKESDKDCVIM
ncbi:hypothetical protein NP233_g1577 [Leucocoprinus birnbaumii]|uniref:AN1-type domain-containing protein n=1 Tax=Leucocoprinus birnbaumii TaxID=56174 RepID=A0AAD5VZQ3_9AGAR|nr:hypothetical protein NP233_g1577 [Leucocoprinus birnbaumii]